MTITLTDGNTVHTLCEGDERNSTGGPVGPSDLRMAETPGAVLREYVGADRVEGEHVRCDSGSVSFGVTRTFATVADALAYISGAYLAEPKKGVLKFNNEDVFGAGHVSVVTQRTMALVGCTVAVNYTIQG